MTKKSGRIQQLLFILFHPLWRLFDRLAPKRDNHWAFATHHIHTSRFIENQRAVFEYVKNDASIRKLIFYRGQKPIIDIEDGCNYEFLEHGSIRGLLLLSRCRVVFLTHSVAMDFSMRWGQRRFGILKLDLKHRIVVNLWHGIPFKRLLAAANEETRQHTDRVPYRRVERKHYAGLIASSDVDSYSMAAMFYPLSYPQIWLTGLPRNDFLLAEFNALPAYIRTDITKIRAIKGTKRLIVYAPTYRQAAVSEDAAYYQFSGEEITSLKELLARHDAILGYRPHYFRNSDAYFNLDQFLDDESIVDLSQASIAEFSAIARECDVLVTDYSSVYIETLYLNKPTLSFCYDLDHYTAHQDGLLYEMPLVFPGPACTSFAALLTALEQVFSGPTSASSERMEILERFFFKYRDTGNSARVCQRVKKHISAGRNGAEQP